MNEFLWSLFQKSGNIDYYLAYKQFDGLGEGLDGNKEDTRDSY